MTTMDMAETLKRLDQQKAEFDAADKLAVAMHNISVTPVVDDDYPQVRHLYESALADLLRSMKENGRFVAGNRYALRSV